MDEIFASDLPCTERMVMLAIAYHINAEGAAAWPSVSRLAAMTGAHRTTIMRATGELVRLGWLVAEKRFGAVTSYRIGRKTSRIALPVAEYDPSPSAHNRSHPAHNRSHCAPKPVAPCDTEPSMEPSKKEDSTSAIEMPPLDDAEKVGPEFTLRNGAHWRAAKGLMATLAQRHPGQDLMATLTDACLWMAAKTENRKTEAGMPAFLNTWLRKSANGPARHSSPTPQPQEGGFVMPKPTAGPKTVAWLNSGMIGPEPVWEE